MSLNLIGKAVPTTKGDVVVINVGGREEMAITILPKVHPLLDFELWGLVNDGSVAAERVPLLDAAGDYTAALDGGLECWPVRKVSADLRTLATNTLGWIFLNTGGLKQLVVVAQGSAGGTIDIRA